MGGLCLVGAIAHAALGACVPHKLPSRRHGQCLRSDGMGGGTSLAWQGPHGVRRVLTSRTSPCGCDRPGSTPGADLFPSPRSGASQWTGIAAVPRTAFANSYLEAPSFQPAHDSMLASQLAHSTPRASTHERASPGDL
jgi:hypothetical protein